MKRKYLLWMLIFLMAGLVFRGLWENTAPEMTYYTLEYTDLPASFDGLSIAQISDLHNGNSGPSNAQVLELLEKAQPDVILITGDLIDSRNTDVEKALDFVREAVKLAPCYYVTGNHEARSSYPDLKKGLEEAGVVILDNAKTRLEREGETITLMGLADPAFRSGQPERILEELTAGETGFRILLCHRPELFGQVADYAELVFSGHAHGGQIRLPVLGGLAAPGQGLFPEYDAGVYDLGDTTLILSRGLGNSLFPLRLGNRPEVVVTILQTFPGK